MLKAIILAAGKGTRMKSDKPKVVHEVLGKPMVYYSIEAAKNAGCEKVCVIVGYKAEEVEHSIHATYESLGLADEMKNRVSYALQKEQLGTGHAVKCASDFIGNDGDVVVLCGDTPLVTADTLESAIRRHKTDGNGVTVCEVNSGMYIFQCDALLSALSQVKNDNAQGEYYLPDTIGIIKAMGLPVDAVPMDDADQIRGVNTLEQLVEAEEIMKNR